jgi:magnesium-transporting ATPase (P-type)
MSDSMLWRSLVAGGIVTAACLVAIVAFVPDGKFVIPGQDFAVTEHEFMQDRSPGRDVTKYHSSALVIPGDTDDKSVRPFYDIKNKIRNSLGRSNYLAVFFVFLFAVAVFCQSRWFAVLFALLTIATLSRFGILWMCAVFLLWLAHRSKLPAKKIIGAIFLCVLAAVLVVILFPSLLQRVPGIQSFDARLSFWASGLQPAADHFLVGAPRSALLDKYGYMITWNPHNSVIWIISIFGTWGLMFYGAYVFFGMRSIYRQATEPLWLGIFVGLAVAFAWSMFEIIVLTPAFEILMAVIFGVALAKERDSKKLAST